MLQRNDAQKIARKIDAERVKRKKAKHMWFKFSVNGKTYRFSIRHGRKSDHKHLINDLGLPLSRLQQLAQCSMSAEEYFSILRENS